MDTGEVETQELRKVRMKVLLCVAFRSLSGSVNKVNFETKGMNTTRFNTVTLGKYIIYLQLVSQGEHKTLVLHSLNDSLLKTLTPTYLTQP